jgi:undecaprenyl-diphosphatase
MELWEALILGLIQGLTEFLPVSSSGHIELGKVLLGAEPNDPLLFSIVVHAATALSTIVIFRKVIWDMIKDLFTFKWNEGTRYVTMIALSMLPVAVVGILWEDKIEELFDKQVLLVGFMLLVTGVLLFMTTKAKEKTGKMTFANSLVIGISQAIAILPGISRSGATISTALLLGINREQAARFSFLMVLPPILGATLIKGKKYLEQVSVASTDIAGAAQTSGDVGAMELGAGFVMAFLSGLLACTLMIKLVKNSKLQYFAYYCFAVGIIAIATHFI